MGKRGWKNASENAMPDDPEPHKRQHDPRASDGECGITGRLRSNIIT
jgi:hypothetical protein